MPVTKEIIDEQLKRLGNVNQWFTRKEIKYLPEVIDESETICAITSGLYNGNTWLIVVTQKRVLFLDKGMLYGLKQVEIPIKQISGITHHVGLVLGKIEVASSGTIKVIEAIKKEDVGRVAYVISELVSMSSQTSFAERDEPKDDSISQLERLAKLKEQGIINEDEFIQQKKKILGS